MQGGIGRPPNNAKGRIHMTTRIETITIRVHSADVQVTASAAHRSGGGWNDFQDGQANVSIGDMYAPTYSLMAIDIDNTRRSLANRLFGQTPEELNPEQTTDINAVVRACILVAGNSEI